MNYTSIKPRVILKLWDIRCYFFYIQKNKSISYWSFLYIEYMKVNENIALAKAILNRRGIIQDSSEFGDYLKIREMCQKTPGYVGILTRLRFEDGVSDMDELEHILDTLKEAKIDLGQISKMSYEQILSLVIDKIEQKSDTKDLEFICLVKENTEVFSFCDEFDPNANQNNQKSLIGIINI
jgi:hypothetical protein